MYNRFGGNKHQILWWLSTICQLNLRYSTTILFELIAVPGVFLFLIHIQAFTTGNTLPSHTRHSVFSLFFNDHLPNVDRRPRSLSSVSCEGTGQASSLWAAIDQLKQLLRGRCVFGDDPDPLARLRLFPLTAAHRHGHYEVCHRVSRLLLLCRISLV